MRQAAAPSSSSALGPQIPKRLDFNSHAYDRVVENCFGAEVRDKARALLQTPGFQDKVIRNLHIADQPSDRLAGRMRQDAKAKADFATAVSSGIAAVKNPCEELVAFMDHAVNIPDSFDRDLIELGAQVFLTRLNPVTFFAYGIPGAALQTGVLGITAAALMTNQPRGEPLTLAENADRPQVYERLAVRFMETFKWFTAVAQPGAGQLYSQAFRENCRIRIIHSQIRNVMNKGINQANWNFKPRIGWYEDELGTPLSAADGAIVVTTMAAGILMAARDMELPVSARELQGLFQFTSYLNYMQGVPEELLFPDAEDTAVYFSAYLMSLNIDCRHEWARTAFNMISKLHLEKAMFPHSRLAQHVLNGLMMASWNEIYDEDFRRLYAMQTDTSPVYRQIFRLTKLGFRLYNRVAGRIPVLQRPLDSFGLLLWNDIFPAAEDKIKQHYAAIAQGTELAGT